VFSPAVAATAWNARQERLDRLAYGESAGFARNAMNTVFDPTDSTNYAYSAHEQNVAEEMKKLKEKNPSLNHPMLRDDLIKGIEAGDKEKSEAAMRLLVGANNWNEVYRMLGEDPKLKNLLHSSDYLSQQPAKITARRAEIGAAHGRGELTDAERDDELELCNAAENGADYDNEARWDTLQHMFGMDNAMRLVQDFGENGKDRGDFSAAEGYDYSRGKGWERRAMPMRAFAAAVENSKLASGKKMQMFRGTMADMVYGRDGSERVSKMTDNFKFMALHSGFSADDLVERNISNLSANVKQTLGDKKMVREVDHLCSARGINEFLNNTDPGHQAALRAMHKPGETDQEFKKRLAENAISTKKLQLLATKYAKTKRKDADDHIDADDINPLRAALFRDLGI
jgi:hypothetical protein